MINCTVDLCTVEVRFRVSVLDLPLRRWGQTARNTMFRVDTVHEV